MPSKKIDIRMIKLSKWQIPKTEDILAYPGQNDNTFLSIGYFDMMEVHKVDSFEIYHPLLRTYYSSHRHQQKEKNKEFNSNLMKDYATQELILFTDIGKEGFSEDEIRRFWKDNSILTFLSLIHVDNDMANSPNCEIGNLISKIKKIFAGESYLYYFSFDYSGIVILAKGISISQYLDMLFKLNFDNGTKRKKWIRDSFSLYTLNLQILKSCFEKLEKKESIDSQIPVYCKDESFSAAVNIGVQNYTIYRKFFEELEEYDKITKNKCREYGLLGRHDISIVNNTANLKWLIYIQYLLNKYTYNGQESPFFTYETFIKVFDPPVYEDRVNQTNNVAYECAAKELEELCDNLEENLNRKQELYCGEYISPIRAVEYSILGILKNRFAEDFVLCMYQSFVEFLKYLIEKLNLKVDDVAAFDKTFNEYFRGLNSLVNSAMHSERQFVQATAFNAIIYDVPSKIMAFYVAIIQEMLTIVKSDTDKRYTFLLTPSFREQILVKVISYEEEKLPYDRILMVSISERSLYNPSQVIHCMAHEIAHFVGDKLRNRPKRKQCLKVSVVFLLLYDLFPHFLYASEKFDTLKKRICQELNSWDLYSEKNNYSDDLKSLASMISAEFYSNTNIKHHIKDFLTCEIKNCSNTEKKDEFISYVSYISLQETGVSSNLFSDIIQKEGEYTPDEIDVLTNLIWEDIFRRISEIYSESSIDVFMGELLPNATQHLGSGILQRDSLSEYVEVLLSAYSEAFADIQMILLLDMTYEKYLISFIFEEQLDIGTFESNSEDLLRIVAVVMAMKYEEYWEIQCEDDMFKNFKSSEEDSDDEIKSKKIVRDKLIEFHKIIQKRIKVIENTIDKKKTGEIEPDSKIIAYKKALHEKDGKREKVKEAVDASEQHSDEPLGDDLFTPLVADLLDYLIMCVEDSAGYYTTKVSDIKKLKDAIDPVIACDNIKQVFFKVCQEIDKYKSSLFNPTR